MQITAPGLYPNISAEEYFGDPIIEPSLTQSLCKIILKHSPLHAWYAHPRLNPDYTPSAETRFDIGTIAHAQLIGRGKDIVVLPEDYTDWRRKDARLVRDAEAARGRLAVLHKHMLVGQKMARAALAELERRGLRQFFGSQGDGECMLAWRQEHGSQITGVTMTHGGPFTELKVDVQTEKQSFWCRQLLDWLTADRTVYCDYKTTEASAAPDHLSYRMLDNGWHIQAAFAEMGLNALYGPGKRRFLFLTQEVRPPYALTVAELSESVLTIGRKQVAAAMAQWQRALADNIWPAYPSEVVFPDFPAYAEAKWLEREQHDADRAQQDLPAKNHFMGG